MLVGIENTQRRDLTGATEVATDKEIAPIVWCQCFSILCRRRTFPLVEQRYRVNKIGAS